VVRKKRQKFLGLVISFLMVFSSFMGLGEQYIVRAESTTVLSEGFDSILSGGTTSAASAPVGWTFTTIGAYGSTSTGYFATAPSAKLATNNAQIITPTFKLDSTGNLSFWLKGASASTNSHLLIEKNDGTSWSIIEDIKPISNYAITKTYTLESNIIQIRFTYTKDLGNVALDDVLITQTSANPPPTVVVSSVTLDKESLNLNVNDTVKLNAVVNPADATDKSVTWSSDNTSAAVVDQSGNVTAKAVGTANITVMTTDSNKTASCAVTVIEALNKTFDLIEVTDFHGQLMNSSDTLHIGAALAKVIKDIKNSNPDRTLIMGGGDLYQGTPVSNVLRGVPVKDTFTNIGMEVTALGNHEFDWGLDVIKNETMVNASYEIVCANLFNKGTIQTVFNPYNVITKDGVRIAIIGAITNETPTIVLPANVANFEFKDAATEINTATKKIRDNNEADVVLAVIHDGGTGLPQIVSQLQGVDAVFGGHSHTTLDSLVKDADGKDIPTLIANSTGKGFVDLKMTIDLITKSISFSPKGSNYKGLTVTSTTPLDSEVKAIVDKAYADLGPIFIEKIGTTAVTLTKDQLQQPYGSSQLGNWMSDVIKNYGNADVGMQNNGGIRLSPIPAGDITVGTIFKLMPFDNTVCTVNMTGAQLKTLLEQAVQNGTNSSGKYDGNQNGKGIQISGVKFEYDLSKPSYVEPGTLDVSGNSVPAALGQRITKLTKEDGTVIKDTDVLKVAAPDFLATGGDTFTIFLDTTISKTFVNSLYTVRDALLDDVRAKNTIPNATASRIINVAGSGSATEMTIAQARAAATGNVILTGVVSTISGKNVFIQDATAGICVFNSVGASYKKGDKVKVTGPLSLYYSLLEVTPRAVADVEVLSSNNTVSPKIVTANQINESLEGQLIQLKGVVINNIDTAATSTLRDSTGTIDIYRIPSLTGIAAGDTVDVTSAVGQYKDNYQLYVGDAADVVKVGTTPVPTGATISVVATSDLHGNILNWDYASGKAPSTPMGLAKVSTYVKGLRAANPNVILVDNGDTIQGTPLVYYYNMIDKTSEYPMMKIMGLMRYDTWTLGNHEFNYGLDTLNRITSDASKNNIHVLSANTYKDDNANFVEPYFVRTFDINGKTLKVGILGLTTKTISSWEDPAHYAGLRFNDLVEDAKTWVPKMKAAGADVVIVTAHTGEEGTSDLIPENQIKAIATGVPGIDAIVAGHTHSLFGQHTYTNTEGKTVIVTEPGRWAQNISQIDIAVDETGKVTGMISKNVKMDAIVAEDADIIAAAQPYQDETLRYIQTKLGTSTGEFTGAGQATQPTAIMDLVNKVQKEAAGTQLSIAAPLSDKAYIPQGDVTIQNIMSVYVYENFLFGVKMTGKQIKDWMELAVSGYEIDASGKVVVKSSFPLYNVDQLYGATYEVDLAQPTGSRIKNLKYSGKLIKDTDSYTVAINNYRYNGGGGFMAAAGLKPGDENIVTYDSAKRLGDDGQVRSLMMDYIKAYGTISPDCLNGWKISTLPVNQQFDVTGVMIDKSTLNIKVGQTDTLVATVLPENATNKNVIWSSSDESVATVNDGIVTAVGPGTATIKVITVDGNFTAAATALIVQPVTGVILNSAKLDIRIGNSQILTATVLPQNVSNKKVEWKSSDESVATVFDGVVTALTKGTATITVTTADGNYSANAVVNVSASFIGIELNKSDLKLEVGKTKKLVAQIVPGNLQGRDFIWESSNTNVATVKDGLVTAVGEGAATIMVKTRDGKHQATAKIVVEGKVAYIKIIA
jgi:2',3'-cyclic-nucleotide 2'-phosphodiesterase (5'-nucleotidase family)